MRNICFCRIKIVQIKTRNGCRISNFIKRLGKSGNCQATEHTVCTAGGTHRRPVFLAAGVGSSRSPFFAKSVRRHASLPNSRGYLRLYRTPMTASKSFPGIGFRVLGTRSRPLHQLPYLQEPVGAPSGLYKEKSSPKTDGGISLYEKNKRTKSKEQQEAEEHTTEPRITIRKRMKR